MTRTNGAHALAIEVLRPAIVEAKLLTEKHAHNPVYVAALAEELRAIDRKVSALEEALDLSSPIDAAQLQPCRTFRDPNANWIRQKSGELDLRLRRIQKSSGNCRSRS
ncbi:MAG: hypothetical protein WA655_09685 [Candidatus Korobacteraceae bacterium]